MTDGKIPAYDETTPTDSDAGDPGVMSRSTDDGGDVAEQRDPDTIQREIEQTRAELADTIDAIADRISPKRAASRGAQAVKTQVSAVFSGHGGAGPGGAPASVLDAPPGAATKVDTEARRRSIEAVAREGGGAAYAGTTEFSVSRQLRTDRVLLLAGAVAAVTGVVILWRARD
jgi:hypothetical protein